MFKHRLLHAVIYNPYHFSEFPPVAVRRPGLRKRLRPFQLPPNDDKNLQFYSWSAM